MGEEEAGDYDLVESALHYTESEREATGKHKGREFTVRCYPVYDDGIVWQVKARIRGGSAALDDFEDMDEAYDCFERVVEEYGFVEGEEETEEQPTIRERVGL